MPVHLWTVITYGFVQDRGHCRQWLRTRCEAGGGEVRPLRKGFANRAVISKVTIPVRTVSSVKSSCNPFLLDYPSKRSYCSLSLRSRRSHDDFGPLLDCDLASAPARLGYAGRITSSVRVLEYAIHRVEI